MRIKIEYNESILFIYCDELIVGFKSVVLSGVTESIYPELGATGIQFDVQEEGEVAILLNQDMVITTLPPRPFVMTTLEDLAIGEPFCFNDAKRYCDEKGNRMVFQYLGAGRYEDLDSKNPGRAGLREVIIPYLPELQMICLSELPYLLDVINGKNEKLRYNPELKRVECRCGQPANFCKIGYVCNSIKGKPCDVICNFNDKK